MTNPIITDTDDTQKLTKREEEHVRELERLADALEQASLLYGSALDGMQAGLDASAKALDDVGLDTRMAKAEDEIAQKAADVLTGDVDHLVTLEADMDADESEEDALLAEDEDAPVGPAV